MIKIARIQKLLPASDEFENSSFTKDSFKMKLSIFGIFLIVRSEVIDDFTGILTSRGYPDSFTKKCLLYNRIFAG